MWTTVDTDRSIFAGTDQVDRIIVDSRNRLLSDARIYAACDGDGHVIDGDDPIRAHAIIKAW